MPKYDRGRLGDVLRRIADKEDLTVDDVRSLYDVYLSMFAGDEPLPEERVLMYRIETIFAGRS